MDPPKTRKESKKDQKEKGQGKDGKYSQKHIRMVAELQEKNFRKPRVTTPEDDMKTYAMIKAISNG